MEHTLGSVYSIDGGSENPGDLVAHVWIGDTLGMIVARQKNHWMAGTISGEMVLVLWSRPPNTISTRQVWVMPAKPMEYIKLDLLIESKP